MNLKSQPMNGISDISPNTKIAKITIHQLSLLSSFLKMYFMHNWAKSKLAITEDIIRRTTYTNAAINPKRDPITVMKLRMIATGTTTNNTNPLPVFFQKLETPSLTIASV